MAVVVLRGAIHGEPADLVTQEAIAMLVIFAGVGAITGWITDYLVRENVESRFRKRVEWYRDGILEANRLNDESSDN